MKRSAWFGSFPLIFLLLFAVIYTRPQTALMQAEADQLRRTAVSQMALTSTNQQLNTAVNIQGSTNLIPDGSFEEKPSRWTEQSTVPECPIAIAEWESSTGIPAYDGTHYVWGGGSCQIDEQTQIPIDTMVSQSITIPTDNPALTFKYWSERGDEDTFEDFAYIYLDNTEVWFYPLTQANNTYGWVEESLDLSNFAGQTVVLRFIVQHGTASAVGNMFIDFVEFDQPAAQTWDATPEEGGDFSYTTASGQSVADFNIPAGAVEKETTVYFKSASSAGFPLYPAGESPLGRNLTFAGTAFDLEAFDEFIYLPFITNGSSTQKTLPTQQLDLQVPTDTEAVNSFQFDKPIKVRIYYDEAKLEEAGIPLDQVYLYYWTGDGWADAAETCSEEDWIDPPSAYIRNMTDSWFELNICHFSRFGTVG